jgi:hypothetical protein
MKNKRGITIILSIYFFLQACSSPYILSIDKAENIDPKISKNKKILVVGIIKDSGVGFRGQVEEYMASNLRRLGYNTVSALKEYKQGGLAKLGEEQTYIKLCNNGIDVVLTVAVLDHDLTEFYSTAKPIRYLSSYYYERIWNYEKISAELNTTDSKPDARIFMECIFFDLGNLDARCIVQTRSFNRVELRQENAEYLNRIIRSMIKAKVLRKR